jgi:hypothetical protein
MGLIEVNGSLMRGCICLIIGRWNEACQSLQTKAPKILKSGLGGYAGIFQSISHKRVEISPMDH